LSPAAPPPLTADRPLQRAQYLKANGFTPETSPELDKIVKFLTTIHNAQAQSASPSSHSSC
jgi:glucan phosphoethanolaminetransferase (alkaline phosphatase superfamily)